jgi:lipid-binding SYLF domain-containing protein
LSRYRYTSNFLSWQRPASIVDDVPGAIFEIGFRSSYPQINPQTADAAPVFSTAPGREKTRTRSTILLGGSLALAAIALAANAEAANAEAADAAPGQMAGGRSWAVWLGMR